MGGYRGSLPQEFTAGVYGGSLPQEVTAGVYHGSLLLEVTVGVYHGSLLWEVTVGVYRGRLPQEFTTGGLPWEFMWVNVGLCGCLHRDLHGSMQESMPIATVDLVGDNKEFKAYLEVLYPL